jgi:2-isopropylmalate synthase
MSERVVIFDTTLRDGEQAPGAKMSITEKLLIAKNLQNLGVDVIEGGFAASSNAEFQALEQISEFMTTTSLCSLARATTNDIQQAFDAIKKAPKHRIHTFISTSEIHIKYKLGKTEKEVLEMIKSSVGFAKSLTEDVQWSAEDATRTDFSFLCECVDMAIKNGATTINIPDTVGYTTPLEYKFLFEKLIKEFSAKDVIFSSHCHDDLGMAVANSLNGVLGGARQIEATILGIGERAGNCALEEIIMAIKTRPDIADFSTNIDTKQFVKIGQLVSNITGFYPSKNKAIIGENAFSHESGIHQDGMLKCSQTYEIMNPSDVGFEKTNLTLGKLSGRNALADKLKQLNIEVSKEELDEIFVKFKALCDAKKTIYDSDIISIVSGFDASDKSRIIGYDVSSYNGIKTVKIKIIINGQEIESQAESSGILNAAIECINSALKISPILEKYEQKAISAEADAQGVSSVVIRNEGNLYSGNGCDTDTLLSSIMAYFDACLKVV